MDCNRIRQQLARSTLRVYCSDGRSRFQHISEEALCDLLTDLRQLCAAERLDFERAVRRSARQFQEDIEEP